MTLAFPGARLPTALAASLAIHAMLGAALAATVRGWQPGSVPPAIKPGAFLATVRAGSPLEAPRKPAPVAARTDGNSVAATGKPLPAPYYHRVSELTERPAPVVPVEPRFPPGAPDSGRLKLSLYINENGLVDALAITEADPAGVFEEAATQAFAAARFRPGHKDGRPVKSQIALEVRFGEPLPLTRRPQ